MKLQIILVQQYLFEQVDTVIKKLALINEIFFFEFRPIKIEISMVFVNYPMQFLGKHVNIYSKSFLKFLKDPS